MSGLGKLSPKVQASVVKELNFEEVEHVINHDGLLYEFYKVTWDIIGQDFTVVLKVEMARFKLIESHKHGATRLAPKVEGVPAVFELRPN